MLPRYKNYIGEILGAVVQEEISEIVDKALSDETIECSQLSCILLAAWNHRLVLMEV